MLKPMSIGQAAKRSGVNTKMIRHYESIGLISKVTRTDSGYRVYGEDDVHTLEFIRRARDLGFSMKEIKKLLSLWRNKSRSSSEVKKLALLHVKELDEKVTKLKTMADTLRILAENCHGDERPDCPILNDLDG